MYTNERWHGIPGCAVGLPPCVEPHTEGNAANWDSYYCPSGSECTPPASPPTSSPCGNTEPCSAPGLLSTDAPNILTIGDSISMCGFGYGHFVHDMLVGMRFLFQPVVF